MTFGVRFFPLTAVVVWVTLNVESELLVVFTSHGETKPDCGRSFMLLAVRLTSLNKVFTELPAC